MKEFKGKKLRRRLDEIHSDYKMLMEMRMDKRKKRLALCELMDELVFYYELYEIDKPVCPLAIGLYKLIANSREERGVLLETC